MITPSDSPSSPSNYAGVPVTGQNIQAPLLDAEITSAFDQSIADGGSGVLTNSTAGLTYRHLVFAQTNGSGKGVILQPKTLSLLNDVVITSVATDEILKWDGAKWVNGGISTGGIANNSVTDAKLRDSAGVSVIGRSANSVGDPADIVASADNLVCARAGGLVGFFSISVAMLPTSSAAGSYGDSGASIPSFTVDGAGRVTAASNRSLTASDIGAAASSHIHTLTGDVGGDTSATVIGAMKVLSGMIGLNQVGMAQLAQSVACTLVGNATNATANNVGVTATTDNTYLGREGGVLVWSALTNLLRLTGYGVATSYTSTGSATHTFTAGKQWAIFEIIGGGGGGGGGSAGVGSSSYAAGGGGQGERQYFITPITASTATLVVGAKGAGGASATDGNDGGNSTVTLNGIVITAKKGLKGLTGGLPGRGGDSGAITVSTGFTIGVPGANGDAGHLAMVAYNGSGNVTGVTPIGGYGGGDGASKGSGGDGGSPTSAGSDGLDGRIKVWEV